MFSAQVSSKQTTQVLPVYPAGQFCVVSGVCFGDEIGFADDLSLNDVYALHKSAATKGMTVRTKGHHLQVVPETAIATPGATVVIDCAVTLMSPNSDTIEALVLVEIDGDDAAEVYLMPLGSLAPEQHYTLVGVDVAGARKRLAELACVAFSRGTHITAADGSQIKVEDLKPGDAVLTRDCGVQQIRWIGMNTRRAVGEFAPVKIRKGALNNHEDLVVSADHRLFIYQRDDAIGAGRSEVMVKARHLVNGDTITRQVGGHVDYYQLLFDSHQIIYAEGIAVESLLVDTHTRPALPEEVQAALAKTLPGHERPVHLGIEVNSRLLGRDSASKLKQSSFQRKSTR